MHLGETLELIWGQHFKGLHKPEGKQKLEACPDKIHQDLQAAPNPETPGSSGAQESRISVLWRPPLMTIQGFDSI